MRHEIYSWLPPDPPMSGTIQLYHSELPVHTFALGICRVTIRLLHSSALVLMEHPICSTGGVFEERVEYITNFRYTMESHMISCGITRYSMVYHVISCGISGYSMGSHMTPTGQKRS